MNVAQTMEILRATRANFTKIVRAHSVDELNYIPDYFSNNLVWNFGHVIVTQHLLTYGLSGLKLRVSSELVEAYRRGTYPADYVPGLAIERLLELADQSVDWLEEDLTAGKFTEFREYPTSYGLKLTDLDKALEFNTVHEAMHLGTMLALQKLL